MPPGGKLRGCSWRHRWPGPDWAPRRLFAIVAGAVRSGFVARKGSEMPTWVIVFGVLVGALLIGLLANRWVRPFAKSEVQGVKLELLISPLLTLTVLLLAFVLVQVFASFRASKDASGLEAGRVVFEFDIAGYYDDPIAEPMQSALVCYARAVAHQDWPALAGDPELSPAAGRWGAALDIPLAKLREIDNGQPYGTLLAADKERSDGRRLTAGPGPTHCADRIRAPAPGHQRAGGDRDRRLHVALRLAPYPDRRIGRPDHGPGRRADLHRRPRHQVRGLHPDGEPGLPDRRPVAHSPL